jgi:hypothetical protein
LTIVQPALISPLSLSRRPVIEHVLSEHAAFCPIALPAVFEAIANADA